MKKFLIPLLFILIFSSPSYATITRITVTKDSAGTVSGVTRIVTESGQTWFEVDATSGLSLYVQVLNLPSGTIGGTSQLQAGTSGYIVVYNSSTGAYGVQAISGNSVVGGTLTSEINSSNPIRTSNVITGRSKHINLTSATLYTIDLSGASSVWVSAVSSAARSPTSGVSARLPSPDAAGYDVVFLLENSTYEQGTTTYVLGTSGDVWASADTINPAVSKYVVSGTTDAQIVVAHSTGVSKWFIRTVGSPTVAWD